MRAVVDTNVLVSGFVGYGQNSRSPSEVIRCWREGQFELLTSVHVIAEFQRTLQKPWFARQLTARQQDLALALLTKRATVVQHLPDVVAGIATHPEDDLILAAVAVSGADYLVTGDRQLLALGSFGGAQIVTAATFLAVLEADRPPVSDE